MTKINKLNTKKTTQLQQTKTTYEQMNIQQNTQHTKTIKTNKSIMNDTITKTHTLKIFQMHKKNNN